MKPLHFMNKIEVVDMLDRTSDENERQYLELLKNIIFKNIFCNLKLVRIYESIYSYKTFIISENERSKIIELLINKISVCNDKEKFVVQNLIDFIKNVPTDS